MAHSSDIPPIGAWALVHSIDESQDESQQQTSPTHSELTVGWEINAHSTVSNSLRSGVHWFSSLPVVPNGTSSKSFGPRNCINVQVSSQKRGNAGPDLRHGDPQRLAGMRLPRYRGNILPFGKQENGPSKEGEERSRSSQSTLIVHLDWQNAFVIHMMVPPGGSLSTQSANPACRASHWVSVIDPRSHFLGTKTICLRPTSFTGLRAITAVAGSFWIYSS